MSYTDSDDDYEPLDLTVAGFHNTSTRGWSTLVDPQIKIGAGCGQLHRQGRNFRPVDEQLIVDRRLGKPLPPGGLNGPKKKKSKAQKKQEQQEQQQKQPPPPTVVVVNKPKSQSNKAIVVNKSKSQSNKAAAVNKPKSQSNKVAAANKPAAVNKPQPNKPAVVNKPQPNKPQPNKPQPNKPQPNKPQPNKPAVVNKPQLNKAETTTGKQKGKKKQEPKLVAPSKPRPNLNTNDWSSNRLMETPFWEIPNGSAASRYADPPVQRTQVTQQENYAPQHQSNYHNMQHTVNQPTNQYTPCLVFTIELALGVSVELTVYENDDPMNVVRSFETQHQLKMSAEAKHRFAQRVAMLLTKFHDH